jgi:23S rRNA (cytosine1962-C5)-methyltransferase
MTTSHPKLTLKPRREAAVLRRHPWIFSGSVAKVAGSPAVGDLVAVHDAHGKFLAWGHYSPDSQIRTRLISWEEEEVPEGADFWRERLRRAVSLRNKLDDQPGTNAYRLLHAESDGVPGLIVDRYAGVLVAQYLTVGTAMRRDLFTELLWDLTSPQTLYERSDVDVREREGLESYAGLLRGESPPEPLEIRENGLAFHVNVQEGHKTGFYLDQRDNRARCRRIIRALATHEEPPSLLNVFAYTGGFAVYGLDGGAGSVVNVDTSASALALGRENFRLNQLDTAGVEDVEGDAFQVLRQFRQENRRFDVVVLDPPKFAFTKRDVKRASRGYKDINMQAMHLLKPGGILLTFSCSGVVSDDLFQKIVFGAALDTGRDVQIIGRMMQGSDHPVALTFPEGAYLKGLVCRAVA